MSASLASDASFDIWGALIVLFFQRLEFGARAFLEGMDARRWRSQSQGGGSHRLVERGSPLFPSAIAY